MTREQAAELLAAPQGSFHIEHGETVEQTMRYFAASTIRKTRVLGHRGRLHDFSWEERRRAGEAHAGHAAPLIEEAGGTPELIRY